MKKVYSFAHWTTTSNMTNRRDDDTRLFSTEKKCKAAIKQDIERVAKYRLDECNPLARIEARISIDGLQLEVGSFYKRRYRVIERTVE